MKGSFSLIFAIALTACSGGDKELFDSSNLVSGVLIGVANRDDDNGDKKEDWNVPDATDPDLEELTITGVHRSAAQFRLFWNSNESFRVYANGKVLLDDSKDEAYINWEESVTLLVESAWFNDEITLNIEEIKENDKVVSESSIILRSSPLMLAHHLLDNSVVYSVDIDYADWNNQDMVSRYTQTAGGMYEPVSSSLVQDDQWAQDEVEFAFAYSPSGVHLDVAINSIRSPKGQALDNWVKKFKGPNRFQYTWGKGFANSRDSFGNLEFSPPIDGYPAGRIYYGAADGVYNSPEATKLFNFFDEQGIQTPFQVDTSWLCVGHVDEFMTFIPDFSAPRGFRFVYTDIDRTWEIMEGMDPNTELTRFAGPQGHNYSTVGEMLDDQFLRDLNADLKTDYLDPVLELMKQKLNLTDDEIIMFPGIFEEADACYGGVAALQPGMANLFMLNNNGLQNAMMADPFMRTNLNDQGSDPFIDEVKRVLPETIKPQRTDD